MPEIALMPPAWLAAEKRRGGLMLRVQESTIASIKSTAINAEKRLLDFIKFIENFHRGDLWKSGDIPGQVYSLSEVLVESVKVLSAIKRWPISKIGLSSQSVSENLLNSLNVMDSVINSLVSVQEKISKGAWSIEIFSFQIRSEINSEDVLSLSEYAVELFNSMDVVKQHVSRFSFFRRSDVGSDEELSLLSSLISEVKAARQEVAAIRGSVDEDVGRVADAVQAVSTTRDERAAQSAELIAALEEKLSRADSLLQNITLRNDEVEAVKSDASAADVEIKEFLNETKSSMELVKGFSGEVDALRGRIEGVLSNAASGYKAQEGYIKHVERLIERAESMVSGATVAGLAQAFSDERKSLEKEMKWAMLSFMIGIAFIFLVTILLGAYVFEIPLSIGDIKLSGAGKTPNLGDEITIAGVLSRTIILLAPFWLTLFSSRRYRNLFDLRQQYSHKYNMAFSVDGFKQQAPMYEEQIAAWVFHVVSEAPVTNAKRSGRSMDESPMLALQEIAKLPLVKFEEILKPSKSSKEGD